MVVVPLLVSALMLGVYELGKGRNLGKVAGRSIAFTLVLSFLASNYRCFVDQYTPAGCRGDL
ncbi:cation:dicarboxylate symporter family transporter [Thermosinus carboxydivorans]|uniref:cation:dicarboxylate symporter family transporter n=1 Tax=Thermosinus carboxydivorans TaxID=261685 RepID=UPI0018DE24BC